MADFTAHNLQVIQKQIRVAKDKGVVSDEIAITILNRVANSVLDWVRDKNYTYENQTYNLTDSIGCAIYKNGRVIQVLYNTPYASGPRRNTYKGVRSMINGRTLLFQSLNDVEIASKGQYVLGVFVAAPYGASVDLSLGRGGSNKRGKGWFSGPNGLKEFAEKEFIRIKNELINSK